MYVAQIEWRARWLGGFCPLGALQGLPVRGPDYQAHPPLSQAQFLPIPSNDEFAAAPELNQVLGCWSGALGNAPVVLVRNVALARQLLLQIAGIGAGDEVVVPVHASRPHIEAIKQGGATPRFAPVDEQLVLYAAAYPNTLIWHQPIAGLFSAVHGSGPLWLDCSDTIPGCGRCPAEVVLYGLHLSHNPAEAGALIVCRNDKLAWQLQQIMTPAQWPDLALAQQQCLRLGVLAYRQRLALAETWRGLDEAAGLPLLPLADAPLAQGVAVQIPTIGDAATFLAYVQAENTPVRWLPEMRPVHYAAFQPDGRQEKGMARNAAANLSRWLFVPVGPDYSDEEIKHGILGITKAADYLGLRWYTDPVQAADYAAMMNAFYGPEHDAYRPVFEL